MEEFNSVLRTKCESGAGGSRRDTPNPTAGPVLGVLDILGQFWSWIQAREKGEG